MANNSKAKCTDFHVGCKHGGGMCRVIGEHHVHSCCQGHVWGSDGELRERQILAASRAGYPGYCAVMVVEPCFARDTGIDCAQWIRDYTIHVVDHAESARGLDEYLSYVETQRDKPWATMVPADGLPFSV